MAVGTYHILTLLLAVYSSDVVIKQSKNQNTGNVCNMKNFREQFVVNLTTFPVENDENTASKCMYFKFIDQGTENKHQIYEKVFDISECIKILQNAKYELMRLSKFIGLVMYALSEQNDIHDVNVNVNHGQSLEINIKYTPDQYTETAFVFTIPAKQMNEIDLLKLRLKDLEHEIEERNNNLPILFYETINDDKNRPSGWNIITLDYCNDENNKFIKHNKEKGTIKVSPGKYVIEAEGSAYYVNGHIIQIINDEKTLKINGIPQYSHKGSDGYSTTTSRILKQVIDITIETNLIFRWYFQTGYAQGALYGSSVYPKNDIGNVYSAAVSIQRV